MNIRQMMSFIQVEEGTWNAVAGIIEWISAGGNVVSIGNSAREVSLSPKSYQQIV